MTENHVDSLKILDILCFLVTESCVINLYSVLQKVRVFQGPSDTI